MIVCRVFEPSELVDILIEKEVQQIIVNVIGCFARTINEKKEGALLIERHEKELIIANSEGEEMKFPIDYVISISAVTAEDGYFEITIDPTYMVKMLKEEVVKDLEQYIGFNKTQEVWHELQKMREELGD